MQQEVKQLQHQIELLSQANKAIFMYEFDAQGFLREQNLTEQCQYIKRQEAYTTS